VKAIRRQTWLGLGVRAVRALLNDHPAWVVSTVLTLGIIILLIYLM
jgi:hypothetical protein